MNRRMAERRKRPRTGEVAFHRLPDPKRTFSVEASLAPASVQKVFEERVKGDPLQERSLKLVQLGLKYNGESYVYRDINFHWMEVISMSDVEFNVAYEGAVRRMAVLQGGGI